jgi:hypothetical protein
MSATQDDADDVANVRVLHTSPPSSSEVATILRKLEHLEKLMVINNRAFPTWAMTTLFGMGLAHLATLAALIYIVHHLP